MARKKKFIPTTPEEVAGVANKATRSFYNEGAASHPNHGKLFSKEQYLKDKNTNTIEQNSDDPKSRVGIVDTTEGAMRNWANALLDYSKNPNNRDITGFLMLYEIPPRTYYDIREKYEFMRDAHDMAINNFAYNNLMRLEKKGTNASHDVARQLFNTFHPEFRRLKRDDALHDAKVKALVMEEMIDMKKKLMEEVSQLKVTVDWGKVFKEDE